MNIVGVSGKAGAGKDWFCDLATVRYQAEKISFAGGLKEEVGYFLSACGIKFERRNLYGTQEDKEETFSLPSIMWQSSFPEFKGFVEYSGCGDPYFHSNINNASFRQLLQWWGTEYRRAQDDQYWVKRCLAKCEDPNKLYVIADMRFKNEAQAVRDAGGKLVRIERPNGIDISNMNHASEIDLDDWEDWDVEINNNGTLDAYSITCLCIIRDIINGDI